MALTAVQMLSVLSLIKNNNKKKNILLFCTCLFVSSELLYLHKSVLNDLLTPPHLFTFHPCAAIITLLYLLCSACLSI